MEQTYSVEAHRAWDNARRRAFLSRLAATLRGKDIELLDFEEISHRLQLRNSQYRGVQTVPLSKIVGSVGRYHDFIKAFLPVTPKMEARWEHIAEVYLNPESGGVPPIELYKVGEVYFVRDGNHRVSVCSQLGIPDIEAHVWEYPVEIEGINPDADIDELLIEIERQEFLSMTRLDELRPGHNIRVSVPGGYTDLLRQIARFQGALTKIDERTIPYHEAVAAWYDMLYQTITGFIEEQEILDHFPGRTSADAFVWVLRHQRQLELDEGGAIPVQEIIETIEREHGKGRLIRWWRSLTRRWRPPSRR